MEEREGENQALIEHFKELEDERFDTVELVRGTHDKAIVALVPTGKELRSIKGLLDEYRVTPERKRGTTTLYTLEAFCEFVNTQKTLASAVYCDVRDPAKPKLVAVFNATHANTTSEGGAVTEGAPDWQDHRAVYDFPLSDEWVLWKGLKASFTQQEFAEFLEDRITDVLDPVTAGKIAKEFAESLGTVLATPTRLLSLSRGLALTVDCKVTNVVNLQTGEVQFMFTEQHADAEGKPLNVPGAFAIGIPVFRNGHPYTIPVRLRYRQSQGKVHYQLAVQRLDVVFEDAISDAETTVTEKTGLPLYRGTPG